MSLPMKITVLGIIVVPRMTHCIYIVFLVTIDPSVAVMSVTATSISLSWSVPNGTVVSSYEVKWQVLNNTSGSAIQNKDGGSGTSGRIASNSHTIEGLEMNTTYNITVTVNTAFQNTGSQSIITFTGLGC